MSDETTWAKLLAAAEHPDDQWVRVKELLIAEARDQPQYQVQSLSLASEVLAAEAVRRGAAAARDFLGAIAPLYQSAAISFGYGISAETPTVVMELAAIAPVAETVGVSLALPPAEAVDDKLADAIVEDPKPVDKITLGLLGLIRGRLDFMNAFPKMTPAKAAAAADQDPQALMRLLHAAVEKKSGELASEPFTRYMSAFPSLLQQEKAEWRHLALAGRIVLAQLGDVPLADVAETLHGRARQLAGRGE